MLKNTKNAFISIINEIKLVCKIIKYSSIGVSLVYFLIALLTKTGNFIANIISLSLFIVYIIFEISTRNIEKKKIRKVVRRIYVSARLLIRAFALGTIIYGIYT